MDTAEPSAFFRHRTRFGAVAAGVGILALSVFGVARWVGDSHSSSEMIYVSTPGGPYVCGESFAMPAVGQLGGLTLSIPSVRRQSTTEGPRIQVAFSSDRQYTGTTTPAAQVQVLYLEDGAIVGGGPTLSPKRDDGAPQAQPALSEQLDVQPGKPVIQNLGARNGLCGSLTWSEVWSDPSSFEVLALAAPAEDGHQADGIPFALVDFASLPH
ncbi:hypothetical protein Psi02_69230 [Planotetraspora silvatica]|uniref:Uncharacterized protein n=1 Tax=Planotetraspora silvatica TaxID=234614 RepID=A0A8J3URB1_9ACTN|nr:hypothetical protein [Planotetraspora silvatica]GII50499.1 hypothetical protein Psi02_69230 [Planotetraspora silvatica]